MTRHAGQLNLWGGSLKDSNRTLKFRFFQFLFGYISLPKISILKLENCTDIKRKQKADKRPNKTHIIMTKVCMFKILYVCAQQFVAFLCTLSLSFRSVSNFCTQCAETTTHKNMMLILSFMCSSFILIISPIISCSPFSWPLFIIYIGILSVLW